MPLRLGYLHDALLSAGADATKAEQAAEEVASYERRMATIDKRLSVLTSLVATLVALQIGNLWLSFTLLSRLGDLASTLATVVARLP